MQNVKCRGALTPTWTLNTIPTVKHGGCCTTVWKNVWTLVKVTERKDGIKAGQSWINKKKAWLKSCSCNCNLNGIELTVNRIFFLYYWINNIIILLVVVALVVTEVVVFPYVFLILIKCIQVCGFYMTKWENVQEVLMQGAVQASWFFTFGHCKHRKLLKCLIVIVVWVTASIHDYFTEEAIIELQLRLFFCLYWYKLTPSE